MKKFRLTFVSLMLLVSYNLNSQSISEVMRDQSKYVYEIGEGKTIEEADQAALMQLTNRSAKILSTTDSKLYDINGNEGESFLQSSTIINNVYLDNVGRHIVSDGEVKKVMRYMTIYDFEHRYDACKAQIEEYVISAMDARKDNKIDDAIRCFSWAYATLQTYPKNDIEIEGVTGGVPNYCVTSIKELLNNIDIKVVGVTHDKNNSAYPYQLFLDITSNGMPVDYLIFSYFDGNSFVDQIEVKDGRATVELRTMVENIDIDIDCIHKDLARQLDPHVYCVLQNSNSITSYQGSRKRIETKSKNVPVKKSIESALANAQSQVSNQLKASVQNHVSIKSTVSEPQKYIDIVQSIYESIKSGDRTALKAHFLPEAWNNFNSIVMSGNPKIVRIPEFRLIQVDTLVICRSIPLKLKFSGNKTFIEDVVFRISQNSGKVVSVAYTLSARTEEYLMSMDWDDRSRLMLLNFLEDYRTAYCLKNIDYLEKIFAEDAYIITGTVLKKRVAKPGDRVSFRFDNDENVKYEIKSKGEYISDLRQSFRGKEFINIRFEECDLAKGYGAKDGLYAIQVQQYYYSNNYADEGYLTLSIDMRQEKDPLIKVRVWQAEKDETYSAETMIEKTVSTQQSL